MVLKKGEESEAGTLQVGAVIFAAVQGTESRMLYGKRVPVILFTAGADGKGWYWLPQKQFEARTEKFDPKKETSTPFQA
jgi:hypothetical protein